MRRKISERAAVTDALPELTPQQMLFVEHILAGKRSSDAYRLAYDCSNSQPSSVWALASRLRSDVKVALWLASARKAGESHAKVTLENHLSELERLKEIALETGNVGAAVQAEQLRGKVAGHYTDRLDMHISGDPATTLAEIEAEFGEEIAQALARQTQH